MYRYLENADLVEASVTEAGVTDIEKSGAVMAIVAFRVVEREVLVPVMVNG